MAGDFETMNQVCIHYQTLSITGTAYLSFEDDVTKHKCIFPATWFLRILTPFDLAGVCIKNMAALIC